MFPFEHREGNVTEKVVAVDGGRVGLSVVSDGKSSDREMNGTFHSDFGRRTARCSLGRREAIRMMLLDVWGLLYAPTSITFLGRRPTISDPLFVRGIFYVKRVSRPYTEFNLMVLDYPHAAPAVTPWPSPCELKEPHKNLYQTLVLNIPRDDEGVHLDLTSIHFWV
jgi:hypothetical protein